MRQGLFAIVLFINAILSPLPVLASEGRQPIEVTQEEVNIWLHDPQAQDLVDHIYKDVLLDKPDAVQTALQAIPLPTQETVRFLLLKKMETEGIVLTSEMADFIQTIQQHPPIYMVSEHGNDYIANMPVLNSSLVAHRLLINWQQDQARSEFLIAVEKHDLNFLSWLKSHPEQIQVRENILLSEADDLSPEALQYLVEQLVGTPIIEWVPSSKVVVKLAQLTLDERLYRLLWKMKVESATNKEIKRLAKVGDDFSINQLILATQNPTLKPAAIESLIQIRPVTPTIKDFLLKELNSESDRVVIAQQLMASAHRDWLMDLLENNKINNAQSLLDRLTK